MELACRDKNIDYMLSVIEEKKKHLNEKYRDMQRINEENELLDDVLKEYRDYYDTVQSEKQNQYNQLEMLSQYLDTIAEDEKTDKDVLQMLKEDQKMILREMSDIKKKIDNIYT
tara:strand:- start:171 stop:512 length:342 start_codon:yes stop_codon:yes gene_type:complete